MKKTAATIATFALAAGGVLSIGSAAHADSLTPNDPQAPVLVTGQDIADALYLERVPEMVTTDDDGGKTTGKGETPISARVGAHDCYSTETPGVSQVTCADFDHGDGYTAKVTLEGELNGYSFENKGDRNWYLEDGIPADGHRTIYPVKDAQGGYGGYVVVMAGANTVSLLSVTRPADYVNVGDLTARAMTY